MKKKHYIIILVFVIYEKTIQVKKDKNFVKKTFFL